MPLQEPLLQVSKGQLSAGSGRSSPNSTFPKRIHIDRNKLVSSVYAKAHSAGSSGMSKERRFVLKYTDAGIKKPQTATKVSVPGFPSLISRYVEKHSSKEGTGVCIETYRQNTKLSVVTQSFQM